MAKQANKRINNVVVIIICLISLVLIGSSVAMLATYTHNMQEGAGVIGLLHANEAAELFKDSINAYRDKSELFGRTVLAGGYTSEGDFATQLKRIGLDDRFNEIMFMRYFRNGQEYNLGAQPFDMTIESKQVLVGSKLDTTFCAGVVDDRQHSISAVAYCVPLSGCPYADSLALFYPVSNVVSLMNEDEENEDRFSNSRLTAICSTEGEIVTLLHQEGLDIQEHNNIYEVLRGRINNKSVIDDARSLVSVGTSGNFTVTINGEDHILAVSSIREHGSSPFYVVGIYQASDIYSSAYSIISTVLGELAVFFIVLIFVAIYIIVSYRAGEKRLKALNEINEILDCPTRIKFEKTAADIIARNKATAFAVVVIDINHYDYLVDQIGQERTIQVLRHMRLMYNRFLQVDETYGYVNNGRFVLLIHYRDTETIAERLKLLAAMITSHIAKISDQFSLTLYGGIYKVERGLTTQVDKMIDLAIDAENASQFPYDFGQFRLYNEMLHSSKVQNDYIEVHMESALQNNDFKVFYQPKYNMNEARQDGCEALVRWYNPETDEYMQPGVFLPLFEANRFIVQLDHYVYEQVCLYIKDSIANHRPLYPVSVNVSRITASEKDFLAHYIAVKKKHNIADGFLTIEFTESFAYEDYERLRDIVNQLHANGFKCSIDDFGSGFSSYSILKELPMDELKLDSFFIRKGFSGERDLKILSSVIELGRSLNMKVTQEGVETKDQLLLLKKLGCNVIQGYYYAKPLVQSDYIDFMSQKVMI